MHQLENKVIYQIYPKSFKDTTSSGIGDIKGIISKLDYLKQLGVDYIWLSPCCSSPQKDNGYDISDYMTIDPMFGNNDDYLELIEKAKQQGIKIMMDLVLNHTSTEHEWFKKAEQLDEKYYNYYIWSDKPNELQSVFEGSAWKFNDKTGKYYLHMFEETQADLNWSNPDVRKDVIDVVNYWIERGVEGFRLDVIDYIGKQPEKLIVSKGPKFFEYLEELSTKTYGNGMLTVGECWGSTLEETYSMCNDKALTQAFNFNALCVDHKPDKWTREKLDLTKLCESFDEWQNTFTGIDTLVINNHDLPRRLSIWLDDQQYRKQSAKLLITVFGLQHGNLYIYQGDEIGMRNCGHHDIKKYNDVETFNVYNRFINEGLTDAQAIEFLSKISRDNARIPMAWDDSKNGGFTNGTPWLDNKDYLEINVQSDIQSDDSVYRYYQEIINYRKQNYDILKQKAVFSSNGEIYKMQKGNLTLFANFSNKTLPYQRGENKIFGNYDDTQDVLRPYEVAVFI